MLLNENREILSHANEKIFEKGAGDAGSREIADKPNDRLNAFISMCRGWDDDGDL